MPDNLKERIEREKALIEANTVKGSTAVLSQFFDSIFTLLSIAWAIIALIEFVKSNTDRAISEMTLSLAFWIASCQLAPYWNKLAPGYNDRAEVGE